MVHGRDSTSAIYNGVVISRVENLSDCAEGSPKRTLTIKRRTGMVTKGESAVGSIKTHYRTKGRLSKT